MLDGELIDLWSRERGVRPRGVIAHRSVAQWFYERTDRKPVRLITRADVLAFKAKLLDEGQTAANTKMKLSRLRTLLQWAFENDHADSNPAQGINVRDQDAARNRRLPFDLPALSAIFSSPVYSECQRPRSARGEAAYWLPLLALFTGARMEELGQLRTRDVTLHTYPDAEGADRQAWFIHIREDREEGLRLKNAESERLVPVHPELQSLGFIRYVQAAVKARQTWLFDQLIAGPNGKLTHQWGKWFGTYLRGPCGVSERRMVFHSFRHTFKHQAGHLGIIEGVQRQIMGHSPGDVADGYRGGYSLHQLVEGDEGLPHSGLEAPRTATVY